MENYNFWKKQTKDQPLFPDIKWNQPERLDQAGKIGLIGGNKFGFIGLSFAYNTIVNYKIIKLKLLLPNSLKNTIPISSPDITFTDSNISGSFSKKSIIDFNALSDWSDVLLFIGDNGKNSETAILYTDFIQSNNKKIIITRDSIDLLIDDMDLLLSKSNLAILASFRQLQKIFGSVYFPKVITFSMQLLDLIKALHQFTVTYQIAIITFFNDNLIVAYNGIVLTQGYKDPIAIWNGKLAAKIAYYLTWNNMLEAITAGFID